MNEDNAYGLRPGWSETLDRMESLWTLCFKVNLFSPFASLGLERIYHNPKQALSVAKLSYML